MLPNVLPARADHIPVLADEVRELLAVSPGETVVDATFGAGGHSRLLAGDLSGSGKLVAIDRDPGARSYFDRLKATSPGVDVRFLRGDFAVVLSQLAANDVGAGVGHLHRNGRSVLDPADAVGRAARGRREVDLRRRRPRSRNRRDARL